MATKDEAFAWFCENELHGEAHHMHVTQRAFNAGVNYATMQYSEIIQVLRSALEEEKKREK